jgi:selenocysteine-specific elongation factor
VKQLEKSMRRDLILGTAGHIDHGKTSLVKALTGIDCDRLPEEKQRGITIDIGFAHLDLGNIRLGIVDVPGHERFIKNMLAGATGIDLALLIVAADDSIMPQTREHLEILKLLGIQSGAIALTKADLVDETTLQVVELEIRDLVADSFLADAPIVPTCASTGMGIDRLKGELEKMAKSIGTGRETGWFRLPIDRAFIVQGHGTVVTGSVVSGTVHVGDELDWHKGDGSTERVRVRSLSNHGATAEMASRGQRSGINLAGLPHEAVCRGQQLCTPGYLQASKTITVRLTVPRSDRNSIRHRLPVRLHVGTAEEMATISLLDCNQVGPGQWGLAQLFVSNPVTSVWGQPFVLRDSSAEHTLGGGQVLQPVASKIRRRHLETLDRLDSLWSKDTGTRALSVTWFSGFRGVTKSDLILSAGVAANDVAALFERLLTKGELVELALAQHRNLVLHTSRVVELESQILGVLSALHSENALVSMHDRQKTLARLEYIGDEQLLQAITDRLIAAKKLIGDARKIARADFKPKLSANQRKLKDRIVEAHVQGGFQPPEPKEFANHAGGNASSLKDIFDVAVAEGFLVKVSDDLFLSAEADVHLRRTISERLRTGTGLTVAEIRDLLGTTRKFAVPICEHLDRIGLTRREGDLRVLAAKEM